MCGRLKILDEPITLAISRLLGIQFTPKTNHNLRPTQMVSVLEKYAYAIRQHEISWGIPPQRGDQPLFNARAESLTNRPAFRQAFYSNRVIVPCSGWYEWCDENGNQQTYHFTDADNQTLYMAGIALDHNQKLITLTTCADQLYSRYHYCMPLLLQEDSLEQWLCGNSDDAEELIHKKRPQSIHVNKIDKLIA